MSSKGEFLYHGSWVEGLRVLEPRQAKNGPELDGEPAVFATNDIDYAVFMALIGTNSWGGWNGNKYPGRRFFVYEEFLEYLTEREPVVSAHVYFLSPADFEESKSQIYRSPRPVKVLGSLAVAIKDLPSDITVITERHPFYQKYPELDKAYT